MNPRKHLGKQQGGAVETARLMELLDRSNHALHRHQASHSGDESSSFLSLRLARDKAMTRLLRLGAQASELARTQDALIDAKRQLEEALKAVSRLDAT